MMNSKLVLNSLAALLASSDDFSVIDPEVSYSEDESGVKPIVELHVSDGDFSDIGSANIGDKMHSFNIEISIIASSSSKYDLSVLESSTSTDTERATAIESGQRAANLAYNIVFETFSKVFDIITNRANQDFGLTRYTLRKRELGKYKIQRHITNGNLATVFGSSKISLVVEETVIGITPVQSEEPEVTGITVATAPD